MALYAIGDLHLSFGTDKPMDVFGGKWNNYVEKLTEGFSNLCDGDVCMLCGDLSWGMSLDESLDDFKYIENLPGKKIILKGNHDYWWTTVTKMKAFFEKNALKSMDFLHNNCFFYENTAICGTRGWLFDDSMSTAKNTQISAREGLRLRASLKAAGDKRHTLPAPDDFEMLCFCHYPPRFGKTVCREFIEAMNEYGVKACYYGHLHGDGHNYAAQGVIDGIDYDIISADYLGFKPKLVRN